MKARVRRGGDPRLEGRGLDVGTASAGMAVEVEGGGRHLWCWWRGALGWQEWGQGSRDSWSPAEERENLNTVRAGQGRQGKARQGVKRPVRAEPLWKHGRQLEKISISLCCVSGSGGCQRKVVLFLIISGLTHSMCLTVFSSLRQMSLTRKRPRRDSRMLH